MTERTEEEKIRVCIRFLQARGYQVIFPKRVKWKSVEVARLVDEQRATMLRLGGASLATLVSRQELASMLGCSETHIRTLVKRSELPPPMYVGERLPRWSMSEVKAFLASKHSPVTPA